MGGMKDLFGDTLYPYTERAPHQITRPENPTTSLEAAKKIIKKLRPIQEKVLAELRAAGRAGLTDFALETRCGSHGSTFRTRRSELVEAALVADSGVKRVEGGANRTVWVAVEFLERNEQ